MSLKVPSKVLYFLYYTYTFFLMLLNYLSLCFLLTTIVSIISLRPQLLRICTKWRIAKFWYLAQTLYTLLHNLFISSSHDQLHNYGTRTAGNYRSHCCRTNLTQFTILYQGPKIRNSLPTPITSLQSFPSFKKKMVEFSLKLSWISQAAHTQQLLYLQIYLYSRWPLL